jgi:transposase InsO family protein
VGQCEPCRLVNLRRLRCPVKERTQPQRPMQKVSIDLSGPHVRTRSGNQYLLQFTDEFSGWPEVFAVPDKSAEIVCRLLLQEVIPRHGCSDEILTDSGGEFVNQKFARVLREYNIKHIRTSPYHPQSNGRN